MGRRVTVVGAGVVGLTCAVRLAEAGYAVDVLARELPLETTSAVAGGLWLPYLAEPVEAVTRWSLLTRSALLELAGRDAETGVVEREGYLLGPAGTGRARPVWAEGLDEIRLTPVSGIGGSGGSGGPNGSGGSGGSNGSGRSGAAGRSGRDGWHLRVPLVDMSTYLPYLVRRLEAAGATLTRLPLTALPARGLVVNCTGLASRALAADPSVYPIRGQVIRMTNPGLSTWWSEESDPENLTYVLPHREHVVVGGTAERDDWSNDPDPTTSERVLSRALDLVPQLRGATVLSHRVGLRPGRPTVRLETVAGPEGTVVHCYGHGGSGVTLSWGCADDVLGEVGTASA
jgi:D-amino-acid oxidase